MRVARIQVQQNGLAEYDRSLSETRQQLSSYVSDSVLHIPLNKGWLNSKIRLVGFRFMLPDADIDRG